MGYAHGRRYVGAHDVSSSFADRVVTVGCNLLILYTNRHEISWRFQKCITLYIHLKGVVRSKIGFFKNWICESRRPGRDIDFYPNKIRQKLAEIWGVQYKLAQNKIFVRLWLT